ncbi:capsular exopolysaccharide family [Dethiosulfatibacter aminovorans DSM 17477]|uniref:non-specific protein-tyrosine kinase n=1 Tax=Dethiosulfatibacter aminovorans DSM 17477 TaxID=1121476 RepID=A0A1M6LPB9_9FIRM|nr:CpsD/CapB family tyrosine-protein kinase [Dethiosulfatibacter aminovorans]SHJ73013.1 capsular exopolysaccharide family [Dethiosulfatibacter aminovorans DSM 17477]
MKGLYELIVKRRPKSPISEAYRSLRTNIEFANLDNNMKSILITSATSGEGKTLTLINLAVAMAQIGKKVMIIDCDMRKPRVHKALETSNMFGLAEYLMDGGDIGEYIKRIDDLGIDVMTSGRIPSNPSELLHSNVMKNTVEKLKENYDYILFDTPPVIPVTDAVVMSSYVEGAIMIIEHGKVDIDLGRRAKDALVSGGTNLLGVVLNRIPVNDSKSYQSYYYYYEERKAKSV